MGLEIEANAWWINQMVDTLAFVARSALGN